MRGHRAVIINKGHIISINGAVLNGDTLIIINRGAVINGGHRAGVINWGHYYY